MTMINIGSAIVWVGLLMLAEAHPQIALVGISFLYLGWKVIALGVRR